MVRLCYFLNTLVGHARTLPDPYAFNKAVHDVTEAYLQVKASALLSSQYKDPHLAKFRVPLVDSPTPGKLLGLLTQAITKSPVVLKAEAQMYSQPLVEARPLEACSAIAAEFGAQWPEKPTNLAVLNLLAHTRNCYPAHGGMPDPKRDTRLRDCFDALLTHLETTVFPVTTATLVFVDAVKLRPDGAGCDLSYLDYASATKSRKNATIKGDGQELVERLCFKLNNDFWPSSYLTVCIDLELFFFRNYRNLTNYLYSNMRGADTRSLPRHLEDVIAGTLDVARRAVGAEGKVTNGVTHNLPERGYSGLYGRESDLEALAGLLDPELQSHIIVLDGIGGVGKTALAREYCERLLAAGDMARAQYIVWLSAKNAVLGSEIAEVEPELRSKLDILQAVCLVTGVLDPLQGKPTAASLEREVKYLLKSGRFLIVVDNMETIPDKQEMWSFLLRLPAPTKVLVTSRQEVGEGAQRLRVGQLAPEAARELVESERRSLLLNGVRIPDSLVDDIARVTGRIPLAIKHFFARLRATKGEPGDILAAFQANKTDLAEFCFHDVWVMISELARYIWLVAARMERPITKDQVQVVLEKEEEEASAALEELSQWSILDRQVTRRNTYEYSVLPLTAYYASGLLRDRADLTSVVDGLVKKYELFLRNPSDFAHHGKAAKDIKGTKYAPLVAEQLFLEAQRHMGYGNADLAAEKICNAAELSPKIAKYWELLGSIEFTRGRNADAVAAFDRALTLDRTYMSALIRKAMTLEQMRRYAEALAAFEVYLSHEPADKRATGIAGHCAYHVATDSLTRMEVTAYERARDAARTLLASSLYGSPRTRYERENDARAHFDLSRLAELEKDEATALKHAEEAARLNPDYTRFRKHLEELTRDPRRHPRRRRW